MMPPGVLPPKVKKKEVEKEITDKVREEEKERLQRIVETQKASPDAPLRGIEGDLGLTPTLEFLTSHRPAERAAEKVSGDGDDDDEGDEEEDKKRPKFSFLSRGGAGGGDEEGKEKKEGKKSVK